MDVINYFITKAKPFTYKVLHLSMYDFKSLPYPILESRFAQQNKFIADELHSYLLEKFTDEQHNVYSTIMKPVLTQDEQFYFLYGYGRTRKNLFAENFVCNY